MGSNRLGWLGYRTTGNRCLTLKEERLLRRAMGLRSDGQRDFAVFRALMTTGLRIGEFLSLSVGEAWLAVSTGHLFLSGARRKSKTLPSGKKVETDLFVLLRGEALEAFADLVRLAGEGDDSRPLVAGRYGEALTIRAFQLRLKFWAQQAGVDDRISPHWLRHTFAAEFCRKSTASPTETCIRLAQKLGQADPRSCAHYLSMSREADVQTDALWPSRKRMTRARAREAFAGVAA